MEGLGSRLEISYSVMSWAIFGVPDTVEDVSQASQASFLHGGPAYHLIKSGDSYHGDVVARHAGLAALRGRQLVCGGSGLGEGGVLTL